MQKILFVLPIFITACCGENFLKTLDAPSATVYNDECVAIQRYKVFQVIDGGALAMGCESDYDPDFCIGLTVFVPTQKDNIYYDDMIIEPDDGKCAVYREVYQYITKSDDYKTVPKLTFDDEYISNPAYVEQVENKEI